MVSFKNPIISSFLVGIFVLFIPESPVSAQATDSSAIVASGAELTKVVDGFRYTEGPAWSPDGKLYFTDRSSSRILVWTPDGGVADFRTDPDGANGLIFAPSGELISCESGARRVVSIAKDGTEKVLADAYNGKKLNSPNDAWVDKKGGIYFSDHSMRSRNILEQEHDNIYYITPDRTKILKATSDDLQYPNGVITNPAGDRLYVTDSGSNETYVYTVNPDGTLRDRKTFAVEGYDGMAVDEQGNVYITPFANHVSVYNSAGERIGEIATSARPSNVCFGGKDKRTLFVTVGGAVYSIAMKIKGL